jgi:uncharacterized membrane protein
VRRRSSAILLTMGIGNLVMGCLALLCGTCGGGSIVIMKQVPDTQDLVAFMNHRIFGWMVWELTKHGVSLLLGMVLILAGVGLIMQKRWGWLLTLCCAPCTLLQQFAYVLFQFLFVVPAATECQRQISGNFAGSNDQARVVGTVIGILFAAAIHSIYALATIIVLLLPKTLRDLRAAESAKERDLDRWQGSNGDDDDDDYERARRGRRWREV